MSETGQLRQAVAGQRRRQSPAGARRADGGLTPRSPAALRAAVRPLTPTLAPDTDRRARRLYKVPHAEQVVGAERWDH